MQRKHIWNHNRQQAGLTAKTTLAWSAILARAGPECRGRTGDGKIQTIQSEILNKSNITSWVIHRSEENRETEQVRKFRDLRDRRPGPKPTQTQTKEQRQRLWQSFKHYITMLPFVFFFFFFYLLLMFMRIISSTWFWFMATKTNPMCKYWFNMHCGSLFFFLIGAQSQSST